MRMAPGTAKVAAVFITSYLLSVPAACGDCTGDAGHISASLYGGANAGQKPGTIALDSSAMVQLGVEVVSAGRLKETSKSMPVSLFVENQSFGGTGRANASASSFYGAIAEYVFGGTKSHAGIEPNGPDPVPPRWTGVGVVADMINDATSYVPSLDREETFQNDRHIIVPGMALHDSSADEDKRETSVQTAKSFSDTIGSQQNTSSHNVSVAPNATSGLAQSVQNGTVMGINEKHRIASNASLDMHLRPLRKRFPAEDVVVQIVETSKKSFEAEDSRAREDKIDKSLRKKGLTREDVAGMDSTVECTNKHGQVLENWREGDLGAQHFPLTFKIRWSAPLTTTLPPGNVSVILDDRTTTSKVQVPRIEVTIEEATKAEYDNEEEAVKWYKINRELERQNRTREDIANLEGNVVCIGRDGEVIEEWKSANIPSNKFPIKFKLTWDAPKVHDLRLLAYWDEGTCGAGADNQNWEWCGMQAFQCKENIDVESDICPSGVASVANTQGTGRQGSVTIEGCTYAYFVQYACHEYDSRLAAYFGSSTCGEDSDSQNWEWCGEDTFTCLLNVTVPTDVCISGNAQLLKTQGTGVANSLRRDGCNYAYYAQYECTAPVSTTRAPTKREKLQQEEEDFERGRSYMPLLGTLPVDPLSSGVGPRSVPTLPPGNYSFEKQVQMPHEIKTRLQGLSIVFVILVGLIMLSWCVTAVKA